MPGEVHHRVATIDPFERKRVDQVLAGHALAIVFGRPAEQAQEIHESLRQKTGIAIGGHAYYGPMTTL